MPNTKHHFLKMKKGRGREKLEVDSSKILDKQIIQGLPTSAKTASFSPGVQFLNREGELIIRCS